MSLKELYYRLRPLAKVRAEKRYYNAEPAHEKTPAHPAVGFILATCCSLMGGFVGGVVIWFSVGFNPDNSGGTFIFIGGSILMSVASVITFVIGKNRAVFYGLNVFTGFTLTMLVIQLVATLFD